MGENEKIESGFPRLNVGVGKLLDFLAPSDVFIDTSITGKGTEERPYLITDLSKAYVLTGDFACVLMARSKTRSRDFAITASDQFEPSIAYLQNADSFNPILDVEDAPRVVIFSSPTEIYINGDDVIIYNISMDVFRTAAERTGTSSSIFLLGEIKNTLTAISPSYSQGLRFYTTTGSVASVTTAMSNFFQNNPSFKMYQFNIINNGTDYTIIAAYYAQ